MAAFENPAHKGRIVIIPEVSEVFAELHVSNEPSNSMPVTINGISESIIAYQVNEAALPDALTRLYIICRLSFIKMALRG